MKKEKYVVVASTEDEARKYSGFGFALYAALFLVLAIGFASLFF